MGRGVRCKEWTTNEWKADKCLKKNFERPQENLENYCSKGLWKCKKVWLVARKIQSNERWLKTFAHYCSKYYYYCYVCKLQIQTGFCCLWANWDVVIAVPVLAMWLQHLTAFSLPPAGFTIYTGLLPVIQTLLKSFLTQIQTGNSSLWGVNLCLLSDTVDTMNAVQLDQRERGQRKEERKENEFYRYIKTINFHHAVFLLCYEYYTARSSPTVGL